MVETASFLALLTFVGQRNAVAFMARSVARHFEREGVVKVLPLAIDIELPPIGMMTMRGQPLTTTAQQMMECLRQAATQGAAARPLNWQDPRAQGPDMNGADALCDTLLADGVDVCFANPGTSEMHFVAALDRKPQMRCVLGLFEGVVTGAADGYARMADKAGGDAAAPGPRPRQRPGQPAQRAGAHERRSSTWSATTPPITSSTTRR